MEHDPVTDRLYLVFEVIDEGFKKQIKNDWRQDVELEIIGKGLRIKE